MVGGTALRGRPQVTQERHVGRAGEGEEKEWTDCVVEDRRFLASRGTTVPLH